MSEEVALNEKEILQELRQTVALSTQKAVAEKYGVSQQFICDVLKNRRSVTDDLAKAMGYTKVIRFERRRSPRSTAKTRETNGTPK